MSDEREQANSGGGCNGCSSENAPPPSISHPLADRLECPICMLILPLRPDDSIYKACCGNIVCHGCIIADIRARAKSDSGLVKLVPCAFCRAKPPADERERVSQMRRRIDSHDDVWAMCEMGNYYRDGRMGLPNSRKKAMEMYMRAYELRSSMAACLLAYMYNPKIAGAKGNKKKEREYAEQAVRRGSVLGRASLGRLEFDVGNHKAAGQHFLIAACAGHDEALDAVKEYYRRGLVSKDDFANALRAHQAAEDEVKSDAREFAKKF